MESMIKELNHLFKYFEEKGYISQIFSKMQDGSFFNAHFTAKNYREGQRLINILHSHFKIPFSTPSIFYCEDVQKNAEIWKIFWNRLEGLGK